MPGKPLPEKVHVRGLDNLSNNDVLHFAQEHFPTDSFVRIEWIDDTSANFIYNTEEAASGALSAFTNTDIINIAGSDVSPLQIRPAKSMTLHPCVELFVRQGTDIDVKKKGARDMSRYYLRSYGRLIIVHPRVKCVGVMPPSLVFSFVKL